MRKMIIIAGVFLCLLSPVQTHASHDYTISTGDTSGLYYRIGLAIAEVAEKADLPFRMRVIQSHGSSDNLERIRTGQADFALAQSDIINECLKEKSFCKILTSLYTETVQICVRKSLFITHPNQLIGKRVALGAERSGTRFTAEAVLGAAGITLNEITPSYRGFPETKESLLNGTIDAAFLTVSVPHSKTHKLVDAGEAYLLGLDTHTIKRLTERTGEPFYVLSEIPKKSYDHLTRDVSTVGVRACLVCSDRVPESTVTYLLAAIYKYKNLLGEHHNELNRLKPIDGITGIKRKHLHPAAELYFRESRQLFMPIFSYLRFKDSIPYLILSIIIMPLIIFLIFKVAYLKTLIKTRLTKFTHVIVFLVILLITMGAILFNFENDVNENYSTIQDSIWSVTCYVVSGFADRAPLTDAGRFISLYGALGWIIFGSFLTGVIAAVKMADEIGSTKILSPLIKNHVVILGWNSKGEGILKELMNWKKRVVVLCESDEIQSEIKHNFTQTQMRHTAMLRGKMNDPDGLRRVNVNRAHSILILATQLKSENHSPDDLTLITTLCLRKIFDGKKKKKMDRAYVVAEVQDAKMKERIREAGADEVVCTSDLGQNILANCAATTGRVSHFFEDLLRNDPDTNEVYFVDVPERFIGHTYNELRDWVNANCKKQPLIFLGVKRRSDKPKTRQIVTNPKDADREKFHEGDQILVMAYRKSHLKQIR